MAMENTLTWNYPKNGGPDRTIIYKCFFFKHAMFEHRFRPYFRHQFCSDGRPGYRWVLRMHRTWFWTWNRPSRRWDAPVVKSFGNLQAVWSQHHCGNCQSSKKKGWSFLIWGSHDIDLIYIIHIELERKTDPTHPETRWLRANCLPLHMGVW